MEYRNLGRSGLKVSTLCLGSMMFGDQTDEATSLQIVQTAREAGINFIDTADIYARTLSETIVGQSLKQDRQNWIIATKLGFPAGVPSLTGADFSRRYMMLAVERSLQRLQTDYIDIYYLHRDDQGTPLAETVRALADLIRQGKIRYIGVSNFRGWRLAELCMLCDQIGIDRPVVAQPHYNIVNRTPEAELLPTCQYFGVGVAPYAPLARGVLTGKYLDKVSAPKDSRAGRGEARIIQVEMRDESLAVAQKIRAHAEANGSTAAHFAINWVLNNSIVTSLIAGPRTLEQWKDYLAALDAPPFTAEDEALVNTLVAPGHPSTPGFTDPGFPVTGRAPRVGTVAGAPNLEEMLKKQREQFAREQAERETQKK